MHIASDGILASARYLPSSNCEPRPASAAVELVVLHCVSLPLGATDPGYVTDLFLNRLAVEAHPSFADLAGVRVSAHVLIDRAGEVTQYVPFEQVAWHAGLSVWRGRPRCNGYALGIELLGTDHTPFEDAQYESLARLLLALFDRYPRLHAGAVVGHQEVAPGRKTDPGSGFDWPRLYGLIRSPN